MRRILVTGGAGFLGSHFVERHALAFPDDRLVVLDALTYAASRRNIVGRDAVFVHGDVTSEIDVSTAWHALDGAIDVVVHFAAESHVDRSIADAASFWRTNVLGTQRILDAAHIHGVGRLIHVSTDEVYGPSRSGAPPTKEGAPLAPSSPYAASKAAADALVEAAVSSNRCPAIILRPTNNFGTRQFPEKLLPVLILAALDGKPLPLYGDGLYQRDWIDVRDTADAIEILIEHGRSGHTYHASAAHVRNNLDVAMMICRAAGVPESRISFVEDRPGHDRRYALDASALRALGWGPHHQLDVVIPSLVAWYASNREHWRQ